MLSEMSKENLELLSYSKIAELYLKENKTTMNTANLFKEVCRLLELSDDEYHDKIADFFETLTTSKSFILLKDGNWDLKTNHSIKIDMDDIYEESDSLDEDDNNSMEENDDEDDYSDENYDNDDLDSDDIDDEEDDFGDLTIVDEEELEEE